MPTRLVKTVVAATALAIALLAPGLSAQEEAMGAQIVVGIYQPQKVAEALGLQQQMMQQMQGLQQRAQKAQQEGDQAAMQQIQMEAQQIQQDASQKFVEGLRAVMPGVAETTGAHVIATDVSWAAPEVSTQDITQAVIDAMKAAGGGSASGDEGADMGGDMSSEESAEDGG